MGRPGQAFRKTAVLAAFALFAVPSWSHEENEPRDREREVRVERETREERRVREQEDRREREVRIDNSGSGSVESENSGSGSSGSDDRDVIAAANVTIVTTLAEARPHGSKSSVTLQAANVCVVKC